MGRGSSGISAGGAGSTGGGSRGLAQTLNDVENGIKNNKTESAVCVDENGNILFNTSDNDSNQVSFSIDQQRKAIGKIITHNHPNGYCFSTEDIMTAEMLDLKQLRATTPDGRVYVLERTSPDYDYKALRILFKRYRSMTAAQACAPFKTDYFDGKLTDAEFNHKASLEHTKIMNRWLTENASNFGFDFREEKVK